MARKKKTKKKVNRPKSTKNLQQQLTINSQRFKQNFSTGNYQAAIKIALETHHLIPKSPTPLSDAAACAIYLEQWDKAIELAERVLVLDNNHINALDTLSHAHAYLDNTQETQKFGTRALLLRDQPFAVAAEKSPAQPISINTKRLQQGKKIIAFSLYGDSSAYNEPAVMNAELQSTIYPGWQCRFYIDDSVPATTINRLKAHQAEVIVVDEKQRLLPGTMWRFLALEDPGVGRVIFRDADSVISVREAVAVSEWENSYALFHLIRDAGSHTELILAGLWGAVAGAIDDVSGQMHDYVQQQGEKLSPRFADQLFLRERLWPIVRKNAMTHSNLFDFMTAQPLPPVNNQAYQGEHIGDDEGASYFTAKNPQPDGTLLYWTLHSKLSPYIQPDGTQATLAEEREICTYPATQTNGQIQGQIPKRYSRGIKKGLSRITLSTQPPKQ